jgi:hypothetical protein
MPTVKGSFVAPSYQIPTSQDDIARWKREEKTLRRFQNVLMDDPPIDSQAALVLLIKKYVDILQAPYEEGHIPSHYHRVRQKFINLCLKRDGELHCYKCNRTLRDVKERTHDKVTIDHIIKISHGGKLTDMHNMRLACERCNSSRDNGWDAEAIREFAEKRLQKDY